jgi:hypothetical protein
MSYSSSRLYSSAVRFTVLNHALQTCCYYCDAVQEEDLVNSLNTR